MDFVHAATDEDRTRIDLHAIGRVVNASSKYLIAFARIENGKVVTRVLTNEFPVEDIHVVKAAITQQLSEFETTAVEKT